MLPITTSSLYEQSEQEVIPIIDYIPEEKPLQLPTSEIWKLKEVLDESQIRVVEATPSQQPQNYLTTHNRLAQFTKRTTSIMHNSSNRSIPTKTNQDKHRPVYMNQRWKTENQSSKQTDKLKYDQKWVKKSTNLLFNETSRQQYKNMHQYDENRSTKIKRWIILKDIDSNFRVQSELGVSSQQLLKFRQQKKRLLSLITKKLQINKSYMQASVDYKTTPKNNNHNAQTPSDKKNNKLIQLKNALKLAASNSSKKSMISSNPPDKQDIKSNLSVIKGTTEEKPPQIQQQFVLPTLETGQFHQNDQQATPQNQFMNSDKQQRKNQTKKQLVFTFSDINAHSIMPSTFLPTHQKNVSIDVEQENDKNTNQTTSLSSGNPGCLICRVIGKNCSLH